MNERRIAFIGGGNMATAIARGLLANGASAASLVISEPDAGRRDGLRDGLPGALICSDNDGATAAADCVVLAVKPQILGRVCRSLRDAAQSRRPLVISIAAGVRAADIDRWLGGGLAVVRAMPNQPALLGLGVTGMYANAAADAAARRSAATILGAVGKVVDVDTEADIDTVTAVSGSGPAYFYLLIDLLAAAAKDAGLDAGAARLLAVETARGAAAVVAAGDEPVDDLIARVRSPGGTTEAALDQLDADGIHAIVRRAIQAARERAAELADAARDD